MQRSLAQGQREDRAFRGGRGRGRGRGGRGGGRGRGRGGRGQKRGNDAASHDGYKLAKTQ